MAIATIFVYLAFAGALASWIAGAVFSARTGSGPLAVIAWPFAIGRIRRAGGEPARQVNKALVAFLACLMVAVAATSVATNLARVSR